jgi:hypothetical protein
MRRCCGGLTFCHYLLVGRCLQLEDGTVWSPHEEDGDTPFESNSLVIIDSY